MLPKITITVEPELLGPSLPSGRLFITWRAEYRGEEYGARLVHEPPIRKTLVLPPGIDEAAAAELRASDATCQQVQADAVLAQDVRTAWHHAHASMWQVVANHDGTPLGCKSS